MTHRRDQRSDHIETTMFSESEANDVFTPIEHAGRKFSLSKNLKITRKAELNRYRVRDEFFSGRRHAIAMQEVDCALWCGRPRAIVAFFFISTQI